MKLTYFSQQTLPKQRISNTVARVSFSKNGIIHFNGFAVDVMGLKNGDKITMSQDEEVPENFYFFKDPNHGFELRTSYDKKGLLFNHAALTKTFIEALGREPGQSYNFLMAGKPTSIKGDKTVYWGILIS